LQIPYLFTSNEKHEDFIPSENQERTKAYIEQYSSNWALNYLQEVDSRSLPFRFNISFMLWKEQLPMDLQNLPVIESAWDPYSLSSSGALGLWQFMNNSIPDYFVQDRWREDRRDFILSTEAAISKFKFNYQKTDNWILAIAGYNCGINLITRSLGESTGDDYWSLRNEGFLPEQTIHYVPRLLAVNHILHRKVRYQIELNWEKSPYWLSLPQKDALFLPALADQLKMDYQLLRLANAELNELITPQDQHYRIKIPSNKVSLYLNKPLENDGLFNRDSSFAENLERGNSFPRVMILYKVSKGETLWGIAEELGCSISEIKQINGISEDLKLEEGMLLFVPSLSYSSAP